MILFYIVEFQWFLIVLSVRPSRILAISAHRLPSSQFNKNKIHSSSRDQEAFLLIMGFKWLCHLSLHYLPILPGKWFAIYVHFYGPLIFTKWRSSLSSISVHGPFTSVGFNTFYQRWRHWTSVRPYNVYAIFFQLRPPWILTASVNFLSSSSVQWPFALWFLPIYIVLDFWYFVGPLLYKWGF